MSISINLTLQIGQPGQESWVARREFVKWAIVPRQGETLIHDTVLYEVLAVRHDLGKGEIVLNLWPATYSLKTSEVSRDNAKP